MSRQNSALASLTATYTDTDSEPEEDDDSEPIQDLQPPSTGKVETVEKDLSKAIEDRSTDAAAAGPIEIETAKSRKSDLVSYGANEDQFDDEAIDDYDYYNQRDSKEASGEDEDDSSKSNKDSPGDKSVDQDKETEDSDDQGPVKKKRSTLPPAPTGPCSAEAQRIVDKMFESKMKRHLDVNKYIQRNKSFRNPSIYEKLIEYCNIDELGTNYPPEVFNPHGWPASSYYDELAKAQKAEMDRREKARREKVKVEIVSGIVQKKIIPLSAPSTSTLLVQAGNSASTSKEPEKRKSKWDQRV